METNFDFKSSLCTSREQSERLLALGLKKETADMRWANCMGNSSGTTYYLEIGIPYYDCDIPAWSLHRLIEIVALCPCEIYPKDNIYDIIIDEIEEAIKEGYFNKDYLKNGKE